MKENNIQKDWSEILREKAGSYNPDAPKASFSSLQEKMLAAAAAQAAKRAGVRRNIFRGTAVAASLAALITAGVLMFPDRKVPAVEIVSDQPVAEVAAPVAESAAAQVSNAVAEAAGAVAESGAAQAASPVASAAAPAKKTVPVSDARLSSGAAPAASPATSPAASVAAASDSAPASHSETALAQEFPQQDSPARDAAAGSPSSNTGSVQSDLFASLDETDARPAGSIRRQLRKFSIGASGMIAANSGKSNATRAISQNGIVITSDRYGKKYCSFGAPEVHYQYYAPVSAGLSLRYDFTDRLYAETGLRFTYLTTSVTPSGAHQDLLYAGISLGIGCRIAGFGNFDLYGSAYGMPSKCVWGRAGTSFPVNISGIRDIPIMWSAGVAPGIQYNFGPLLGIYAEPTLSYYFKNDNAPQTLYKEKPFYFTLNIGVRFNLQ